MSSTSTRGSSSTSRTAGRCGSRPSSTPPATWAATPACPTWTNSRPKPAPPTGAYWKPNVPARAPSLRAQPLSGSRTLPQTRRGGGPRLFDSDPRVMALAGALCQTLLAATGFTNKNLRVLIAGLLGSAYTPGQMTYDLRRLRLNGLIRRLPHTNRYTLTEDGIRIAVFYTKVYNRLLVPLTAANQPQAPPELRAALSAITRHVDDYADRARLPRPA